MSGGVIFGALFLFDSELTEEGRNLMTAVNA